MEYLKPKYKSKSMPVYCSVQKHRTVLAIPHFHEGIELIRVNRGETECYIGTEKYILCKDDMVFVPPGSVHSVTSKSENAEIQGVVFEISTVMNENSNIPIDLILNKDRIRSHVHLCGSRFNNTLNKLFCEIINHYDISDLKYELEMRALLCKLTAELIDFYYADFEEIKEMGRLQPILEYIGDNYKETVCISDLSRLLNVCDDHLIRLFKKTLGITPVKYIINVRLDEMQKLLINTDMSVTDISFELGFSSVNYMSKVFKDAFGITPSQYRRKNRKCRSQI